MKRITTSVVAGLAVALMMAGCGSSSSTSPSSSASGSPSASATSDLKVALAYDIGGRGDKSFNDAAAAGIDKATAELGVEVKEVEASGGETDAQKIERLRLLASSGYNPVIAVGFAYATALKEVSAQFPDTNFAIVDDASFEAPNVASLIFAENEASYLVGVIAAQASKSGKIGFIGGVNLPGIQKFYAGYAAGAKAVKADIVIEEKYLTEPPDFSGFNDPAKGKTVATGMFDSGVDIIYAAAGGSGSGVFEAAAAKPGLQVIGVDSDQYLSAGDTVKDLILTSALKRVDVAVFDYIEQATKGTYLTGTQLFELKNDGVGYSKSNPAVQPYEAMADEYRQKIIDGSITVPDSK